MTLANASLRTAWPRWRQLLTGLIAVALALSAGLGWHAVAGGPVLGCAAGSSCDQVLSSRWSSVAGLVPVGGLAAGVYLAMLVASFYVGPDTPAPLRRLAWRALLLLAGAAAGSAVWFIIVQKFFLGAFCPWCMTAHLLGVALAGLVLWRAPREAGRGGDAADPASGPAMGRGPATGFVLLGVLAAALMATTQIAFPPPSVYAGGESRDATTTLDPHQVPLVGPADARWVVAVLFDYNCPHCQRLHLLLDEAVRRYHGQLAFALCPAPLNSRCNPYIPQDAEAFASSCELARIGLAVWAAQREAFPAFDQWMFALDSGDRWRPRTVEAARAKAIALLGPAKFQAALINPWVERYLQTSVRLFGQAGGNAIPKLVSGTKWVTPQPNDADDLIAVLQTALGLPPP